MTKRKRRPPVKPASPIERNGGEESNLSALRDRLEAARHGRPDWAARLEAANELVSYLREKVKARTRRPKKR